jgi:NodT family efflux transporter outer membrane factor (OMF) lipoprotein
MIRHKAKYYTTVMITSTAILLGCSVGKNYQRPELNTPVEFDAGGSLSDTSLAVRPWTEFFTDTILVGLIDQAVRNNYDLQLALRNVDIYQSFAKQAKAAWLPALQIQAAASSVNPSENSLNGISLSNFLGANHIEDYTIGGNLSWEIDVWGKIRRRKEAALADYLQQYEARNAIQTAIVANVADAYYNLLMMDEQLAIARRNVLLSDSVVNIMELQRTAGEQTSLAVEQSVAQRQLSELLVEQLEQASKLQENGLRMLLGDWPGEVERAAELHELADSAFATGIPADLVRFRPDVRASEQALIAANARVGVAQASFYPSLNITASGGLNAYQATEWFTAPASLFGVMAGSLTQPLFERRALKTQLEVARAEREQNVIAFRQSVTLAVHDVTNALVSLERLRTQQQIATERVETLQQAVRSAHLLFRSGMADYLDVIIAQRTALDAGLEKAIITRQQLSANVALYRALGGGWIN